MELSAEVQQEGGATEAEPLSPSPLAPRRTRTAWFAEHPALIVVALAVAAGVWAVAGSARVFTFLSNDHDEGVYLLQAHALADGYLFPPAPKHPEAFTPWLSVVSGDRFVVKYTPVHASVLAVGVRVLGSPRWSLGLVAAGVVVMTYLLAKEVLGDRGLATLATVLLGLSPLFLLQTTTFLPYCSSLLLLEAFAFAFFRGMRSGSARFLAGSGLLFGVALFSRPFDALIFGLPFGLYLLLSTRGQRARLARNAGWIALGALLPVVAMLAYYRAATGSPFRPPFNLLEPSDTVGFGPRKLLPGQPTLTFTPALGWRGLTRHILLTSFWGFGGLLLVGFFAVGVLRGRLRRTEICLALVAVTFSCGYAFFWGTYGTSLRGGLSSFLGPFYFLPVLVPVTLLAAKGYRLLWRRDWVMAMMAFGAMLAVSGYLLAEALRINLQLTAEDRRLYAPVAAAQLDQALVFVPPIWGPQLLHPFSWLANDPNHDGKTVYALDRGEPANLALLEDFPGRTSYRMALHGAYRANPPDPHLTTSLEPLRVVEQESMEMDLTLQNPTADPRVTVGVAVNGKKETFVLDTSSSTGERYQASLRITEGSIELSGPFEARVTEASEEDGSIWLSIATDSGDGTPANTLYRRQLAVSAEGPKLKVLLPGVVPVNALGADPWSLRLN